MKSPVNVLSLLFVLLVSPMTWAAELHLTVFLGSNPLQGLDAELNGQAIGATTERGSVVAPLQAGTHQLSLLKNGAKLGQYNFEVDAGQSAELLIAFTDFEKPAEVAIDTFDASAPGSGAPGVVEGYVTDAEGYALPGAIVKLEEIGVEVVSDENGAYRLEAPRGSYTLSAVHPNHDVARMEGLRIIANVGVAATISMRPKVAEVGGNGSVNGIPGAEAEPPAADVADVSVSAADADSSEQTAPASGVQEIVVMGTYKPAEPSAATIERFSVAVTDAISVDELLRFGDSDVAASLKRVVGISVTGGKYAVVRGLDGRYIASTLNGNLMPSTDPFRRDVQLDLFPPDILGGIEIQKNSSAELPGEATGGIIKMVTRGIPEGYVNNLSFSLAYRDNVTGEDLATYEGGDTDILGFDDGLRELPGAVDAATNGGLDFSICQVADQTNCVQPADAAQLAAQLPNIYTPGTESAPPNFGASYTLGNSLERDIGTIGLYGTASYDRSSKSRLDAFIDDLDTDSKYNRDVNATQVNGYFVAGLKSPDDWQLTSKTMVLRSTEDTVEVEQGINKNEGTTFRDVLLEWVERQFVAQQFEGTHAFFDGTQKLDWRVGVSQSRRDSPDRRSYLYLGSSLAVSTVERSYSELVEDGIDLGLDYSVPFQLTPAIKTAVAVGLLGNLREREVDLARIGVRQGSNPIPLDQDLETLLSPENFANDAFRLNARSTSTDSYDAEQDSAAVYVSATTEIGEEVTVVTGVRQDDFTQDLTFPNDGNSTAGLESNEVLPSLAVIYRPLEEVQLRFAYAGTVSRPNITELAPSRFYDERGREYVGCPTCEASTIDNFDLRAEYYFNNRDSASIALFTKEIDQPLERSVADGSGSATDALTFRNNDSATVSGIELDFNKGLFETSEHGLNLGANMAFIESEIELDDVGQRLEIDPKRDLQGQSPFLANLQLAYDHFPTRQKATLLANYFDDRIEIVTRAQPPIEESGRLLVNFAWEMRLFDRQKLSLKLKNLLDEDVEYTQGGRVIEAYKEGREISLGYSVDFN